MPYTYSALTGTRGASGAIRSWINRDDIPIDDILTEAQTYIYERLRVREMTGTAAGTATASSTAITLPTDYLDARTLYWTGTDAQKVQRESLESIEERRVYDGTALQEAKPTYYAVDGDNIVFPTQTDDAYTYRLVYYKIPAALGTATETNFLTNRHPRLLRSMCLALSNEWMKNESERVYWLQVAEAEILTANKFDDLEQFRDTNLVVVGR